MKIDGHQVHASITPERIEEAVRRQLTSLDDPGFCILCGDEQGGCEPDAEGYPCEVCGEKTVYGAAGLLIMVAL